MKVWGKVYSATICKDMGSKSYDTTKKPFICDRFTHICGKLWLSGSNIHNHQMGLVDPVSGFFNNIRPGNILKWSRYHKGSKWLLSILQGRASVWGQSVEVAWCKTKKYTSGLSEPSALSNTLYVRHQKYKADLLKSFSKLTPTWEFLTQA